MSTCAQKKTNMNNPNPIYFYHQDDPKTGYMSNFSKHPIVVNNKFYATSEHYFQSKKFEGTVHEERVRLANSPMIAAIMGRNKNSPLRKDWEQVKDQIMYKALEEKFNQHPDICEKLLSTGNAILIEHTKNDSYWADGGDGTGLNKLGLLLMRLRDEFRKKTIKT